MLNLSGKTAIITGGASGIGFAIASVFARQGAAIELFDVDRESIDRSVAKLRKEVASAHGTFCDVADPDSVEYAVDTAHNRCGRIDLLINNAGVAHVGNAVTTSAADFERWHSPKRSPTRLYSFVATKPLLSPEPLCRSTVEPFLSAKMPTAKSLSEKGSDPLRRQQNPSEIEPPPKGQTPFRIDSKKKDAPSEAPKRR